MYEHNALGYWSGLALCLTKVRSSRARCPATALIKIIKFSWGIPLTHSLKILISIMCTLFEPYSMVEG